MPIRIADVLDPLRRAAPEETAADWDNVGLQCGDPERDIEAVVLALDVLEETIRYAVEVRAGLLIAHHPLIFSPLERIDGASTPGRELALLLENRIALYVAHTNVDRSTTLSMNANVGRLLPFKDFGPVAAPVQAGGLKLVTFVPTDSVDSVRAALAGAGAGAIGDYRECSFGTPGTGTFLGGESTTPALGQKGRLERVEEIRLEMACPKKRLDRILAALWDSHPYEEVAYDLYPLSNYQSDSHYLWRGDLAEPLPLADFAASVKNRIGEGVAPVRFAGDPKKRIESVAWCMGGGKSLIARAASLGVDAYLTGDTGHHDALEAVSRGIGLVDIDHYWTERFFMDNLREYLRQELGEESGIDIRNAPSGPTYFGAGGEGV